LRNIDDGRAEYARRHGKTPAQNNQATTTDSGVEGVEPFDDRRDGLNTYLAAGSASYQAYKNGRAR